MRGPRPATGNSRLATAKIATYSAEGGRSRGAKHSSFDRSKESPPMMMRAVAVCVASCLAVLLCGAVARAQSVAFINPGKSDEIYWMTATQGMQAAARSLGMTFEVRYSEREPLKTFDIAREMVAREPGKRPDYIVITDDYSVADQLVKIIDPAGVKTFLAYRTIPHGQRRRCGP